MSTERGKKERKSIFLTAKTAVIGRSEAVRIENTAILYNGRVYD